MVEGAGGQATRTIGVCIGSERETPLTIGIARRRAKPRWLLLILSVTILSLVGATAVFANLSGSSFEGNDGNMIVNTTDNTDWANVADPATGVDNPSGKTDNGFGQGTKEDNPDVTVVNGSIPPNKNDLTRFYVASEFVDGHNFLYLAWERAVNIGNANLDFEINQEATTNLGTAGAHTIGRTAGDLLVTYDFGGSGTPTLGLLFWLTAANGNTASQCFSSNSLPCWGNHIDLSSDNSEGAVNTAEITDPLDDDATLGIGLFGEAAINLTDAGVFPAGTCEAFGSTFVKSRSSSSFGAELKDFIAPVPVDISNCATPTVDTLLSASSATYGTPVTDTATLSGFVGSNPPGGTITFKVYSGSTSSDCTTDNLVDTISGSALAADGSDATSSATITSGTDLSPDDYEVMAFYSGDSGFNLESSSNCGDEQLTINKQQPSLTTQDSPTTTITIGTSTSISDTAAFGDLITGVAPTGSVSFGLYSDSSCTAAVSGVAGTGTIGLVSGSYKAIYSTSWTPTTLGTYYWGISYAGDSHYLKVPATGTLQCGGTNETLTVGKATPSVASLIILQDRATLSGGYSPTGTVTFKLYDNADCTGNLVLTSANVAIDNGVYTSGTYLVPHAGSGNTYSWKVTYNGDSNNNSVTIGCTVANHEAAGISYAP